MLPFSLLKKIADSHISAGHRNLAAGKAKGCGTKPHPFFNPFTKAVRCVVLFSLRYNNMKEKQEET